MRVTTHTMLRLRKKTLLKRTIRQIRHSKQQLCLFTSNIRNIFKNNRNTVNVIKKKTNQTRRKKVSEHPSAP